MARDDLDRNRHGMAWPFAMAMWSEVAFACEDAQVAMHLLPLVEPDGGCLADGRGILWCSIDLARSLLALTAAQLDVAESIAVGAVAASRRRVTPLLLARELLVLAAVRHRRGRASHETSDLVDEALRIADDSGAALVRQDAERYGLLPR
jgi:hypothetical protein